MHLPVIDPASLASLLDDYPVRASTVRHGLADHDLAGLPALKVLAAAHPLEFVRKRDTAEDREFAPAMPGDALGLLHGAESAPICLRLLCGQTDDDLHLWTEELEVSLGKLLIPISRELRWGPPLLTLHRKGATKGLGFFADHALLLQVRGTATVNTEAGLRPQTLTTDPQDDGAGGLFLERLPDASNDEADVILGVGDGLFLPARTPFSVHHLDGPSVQIVLRWSTADVEDELDSARWRRRFGLAPRPLSAEGSVGFKQRMEARLARRFILA